MRRDHAKYLSLIASITLLHQHQRARKSRTGNGKCREYLEATLDDAELANRLAAEIMGQSLDALLPQTRQLLLLINDHVGHRSRNEQRLRSQIRFTQRELRETFGWGDFQLRRHLSRLVELEYVLSYRTGAKNQRQYELLYEGQGQNGEKFVLGLTDVARLKTNHLTPIESQPDRPASQNDRSSLPARSASDGRSSTGVGGATTITNNQLRSTNGKRTRNPVKPK